MGDVALHDSFFKATLGQTGPLSVLLKGSLPPDIVQALDFDSLCPVPTESVDDSLDRSFMDLAFSARLAGTEIRIYLVVEHKSSPDPETFLQLLRYMVALWMRNREGGRSPDARPSLCLSPRRAAMEPAPVFCRLHGHAGGPAPHCPGFCAGGARRGSDSG
ncbi:MAG: Rpn family recombination-promoting nuclease/putative transposase [Leptospirales bacterium]